MNTVPDESVSPPAAIASYFKRPPLLSTEGRGEYEAMFKALAARVKPQDEFEWFWMVDFLHDSLQIRRWRRAAAGLIEMMRKDALRATLESVLEVDVDDRSRLIDGYIASWFKEDEGVQSVLDVLARFGITGGHITAQAMAMRLPELDKIERMIGDFERRRSASLREIEYYRVAASWRAPKDLLVLVDAAAIPVAPTTEGAAHCSGNAP